MRDIMHAAPPAIERSLGSQEHSRNVQAITRGCESRVVARVEGERDHKHADDNMLWKGAYSNTEKCSPTGDAVLSPRTQSCIPTSVVIVMINDALWIDTTCGIFNARLSVEAPTARNASSLR